MDHPLRTWIWRNRRFFRLRLIRYGIILEGEVHVGGRIIAYPVAEEPVQDGMSY